MFYYIEAYEFCERISRGFESEPVNVTSSLAYLIGALVIFIFWRRRGGSDTATAALIAGIGLLGYASMLLHYAPSRATVVFKIACGGVFAAQLYAMILTRVFGLGRWAVAGHIAALGAASMFLAVIVPARLFGHDSVFLAPLLAIYSIGCVAVLQSRVTLAEGDTLYGKLATEARRRAYAGIRFGYEMIGAGLLMGAGYVARAYDQPVCSIFGHGLYFVWHLFVAAAVTVLAIAVVRYSTQTQAAGMPSVLSADSLHV